MCDVRDEIQGKNENSLSAHLNVNSQLVSKKEHEYYQKRANTKLEYYHNKLRLLFNILFKFSRNNTGEEKSLCDDYFNKAHQ